MPFLMLIRRTITAAAVTISALGYGGIIPLMPLIFIRERVLHIPPEIWRMATSFLITGPKLSIILDPYFRAALPVYMEKLGG